MIIDNLVSPRNGSGQLNLRERGDRKSTRLNSSHLQISYAVFCLKKKKILNSEPFNASFFAAFASLFPKRTNNTNSGAIPSVIPIFLTSGFISFHSISELLVRLAR